MHKNRTFMPFQSLYDLPHSQIPKPYLVTHAPTSDPLSTRIAKARCDAIFRVRMLDVRLEAPGGVVVP